MGPLSVPSGAPVYIDANILIYSVERVQPYIQTLDAFWQDVSAQHAQVLTSELTVLETLVGPLKAGDTVLETLFRQALFSSPDLRLAPITLPVLEHAARLRATLSGFKSPDAIHAVTALETGCGLLLTNDPAFRRVPNLKVTVLRDLPTARHHRQRRCHAGRGARAQCARRGPAPARHRHRLLRA